MSFLTQPQVLEVNMWSGTDNVTTPLHYDVTHNFYVQVKEGNVLFCLHPRIITTFTSILNSSEYENESSRSRFRTSIWRNFPSSRTPNPEVVLEAGDVLFILRTGFTCQLLSNPTQRMFRCCTWCCPSIS